MQVPLRANKIGALRKDDIDRAYGVLSFAGRYYPPPISYGQAIARLFGGVEGELVDDGSPDATYRWHDEDDPSRTLDVTFDDTSDGGSCFARAYGSAGF